MGRVMKVTGVVTQGQMDQNAWVVDYNIKYGLDENELTYITNEQGKPMVNEILISTNINLKNLIF